ncbi:MAG: ribosomal protein S18-alanine N-acetyltransferase [Desulfococcaceae bacterium]
MVRMDREAFCPPWSRAAFAAELASDHSRVRVIRSSNGSARVAAFLVMRLLADEMEILRVAVAETFRRRGLALRLLEAGMAEARAAGAASAFLEVRPANLPARRLYERLGFVPAGRRPGYYAATGEDALIWTRALEKEVE